MPTPFDWPLGRSPYTLWDRLVVAASIATNDQYTMGPRVAQLEAEMGKLAGARALMVANGSLANQLVFETWKVKHSGIDPGDVTVLCPAVTWISSVTPVLSLGFHVRFVDVNLTDFAFDYVALEEAIREEQARDQWVIVWPTALIGFAPNMAHLRDLARAYHVDLFLDACENTLSYTAWDQSILASADMVTTSCYASHQIVSVEAGFVFYRNEVDYTLGRMLRNHGLSRSLDPAARSLIEKANPEVDPQFLFAVPGTNLRPTDVHAAFGLRDVARAEKYRVQRTTLYRRYHEGLDPARYYLPDLSETHVGFCLPVITRADGAIEGLKRRLNELGVQTRPLIGGCLPGLQPVFKDYGPAEAYPNALWLHQHAAYVGLHGGVTEGMIDDLVTVLNDL